MLPQLVHVLKVLIQWPLYDILQKDSFSLLALSFNSRVFQKRGVNRQLGSCKLNCERTEMRAIALNVGLIEGHQLASGIRPRLARHVPEYAREVALINHLLLFQLLIVLERTQLIVRSREFGQILVFIDRERKLNRTS